MTTAARSGWHRQPALTRTVIPGEEWRTLPGYDGVYEVSSLGRVYRVKEVGFPSSGRILRAYEHKNGYLWVSLWRNRKKTALRIHQVVLLAFVGPCPEGMEIRHLDGDRTNNRLGNLSYGTPRENRVDKIRHGTDHNLNKTHCPRNHPYDAENTYYRPDGGRTCRACKRQRGGQIEVSQRPLQRLQSGVA